MPIVVRKSQFKQEAPKPPPQTMTAEEEAIARRFSKVVVNKPLRRGEYFGLDDPSSRYEILEVLGEGGTGRVVRAIDRILEMEVAIKILSPSLVRDASALAALKAEVRITLGLVHPHILRLYNLEKSGLNYMVIMELLKGAPMTRLLAENPEGLDTEFAVQALHVIFDAIDYAHRHGVLHLDLNPANLYLTDDGVIKVIDFGLAKLAGVVKKAKSEYVTGTPGYMSPEQARGEQLDVRSDIYSLGCVATHFFTGHPPMSIATPVAEIATIPHQPIADVVEPVATVLEKATTFDRNMRYATVMQFAEALWNALGY